MPGVRSFWKVQQRRGVWSLVSPEGKPLAFSLGVDCVNEGAKRDKYKADSPEYAAFRHYRDTNAWAGATLKRLRTWGFNTIGAWSDPALERRKDALPYTVVLHLGAYLAPSLPWGDLFDPAVARTFDEVAKREVLPRRDDPNLIGWFTDNELGWWDDTLFLHFFHQPENNRTRQVLLQLLREHYKGDWTRFERDWDVGAAARRFEDLRPDTPLALRPAGGPRPGGDGAQLIDRFVFRIAERYYQLAHEAIRRYDPNHLILGDRYAQWYCPPVARAATRYVDVISTNYGADWNNGTLCRHFLEGLYRLSGKPILIGEFYFAAMENRSGNKNTSGGFPTVRTQRERTESFRTNVLALASLPYVVGAHWFQFYDEPTKGRGDGENYNMGLVDIQDRPYEELTRASARLPAQIEQRRRAGLQEPLKATKERPIPQVPARVGQGGPALWDKTRTLVPTDTIPCADLYACWEPQNLHFGIHSADFAEAKLYPGGVIPPAERMTWTLEIGEGTTAVKVVVRLGPGGAAVIETGAVPDKVKLQEWPAGVRVTALLTLSSELLRGRPLRTGEALRLRATLTSHSRAERMAWDTALRLR